jgi:hypothetical protein
MQDAQFLKNIATKYLVLTVLVITGITIAVFATILYLGLLDVVTLAHFVDAVFKTVAILVSSIWALNRYFVTRADAPQIRIDTEINLIPASEFEDTISNNGLLIYRLDVVNTGKTLIAPEGQFLEISAVAPAGNEVEYPILDRWPPEGFNPGRSIEPGSWSAINDAMIVPSTVKAVRFYLEIRLSEGRSWSWHKTFDLTKER